MLSDSSTNTICEMLYKLRDAVAADQLTYALVLTREVHEKISYLIQYKQGSDCILNCGDKND